MKSKLSLALAVLLGVQSAMAQQALMQGKYGPAELIDTVESSGIVTEIAFFSPEIVNVRKYKVGTDIKKQNLAVTMPKATDLAVTVEHATNMVKLNSGNLEVRYQPNSGTVSFYDTNGRKVLGEKSGSATLTKRKDGPFDSYRTQQSFTLQGTEVLYGLGQLQNGNLNQRNQTYNYMIQNNTSVWVPYVHSTRGYALFWDNAAPTSFTESQNTMTFESAVGYGIDYFFMLGAPDDGKVATTRMRQLTGQAPMIPLWAYGFFQSKERYQSADETMSVVRRYRQLHVPLDCVVQDWQYWGNDAHWNAMEFLNPQFSNYQQMIDSVHAMKARLIISIWANFGPQSKPYQRMKELGALIKQGDNIMTTTFPGNAGVAIYDPYNSAARDAYWQFLYDGIASKGIDAYWMDSSEPDHYQGGSDMEQTFDFVTGLGCTWRQVRNAFPLLHVGGVYDHHRAEPSMASKRVTILTRSAYAGIQRYGSNTWSGDVSASWQTLANQIPAALNLSACGIPNWNSDIGAFFSGSLGGPGNPEYNELYARWLQFATFCPMMRSHGSGTDKAVYVWGFRGDKEYDNEERYINLRYAMLPYIYSTAWQVHQGESFMTALGIEFPTDRKAMTTKDEFLFGRSFLVAPVLTYKATTRNVYLPSGTSWVNFWNGQAEAGGRTMRTDAPFDILPLYVRAGSIIPWARKAMVADQQDWDTLQVRIYPGADGSFTLYEDEGDNYNYEKGAFSTIQFKWDDANSRLDIGAREGEFKGMLKQRVFDVVVVSPDYGLADTISTQVHRRVEYGGQATSISIDRSQTIDVQYSSTFDAQTQSEIEFDLKDFNPQINGQGSISGNKFRPTAKGFGGWWNTGGYYVGDTRYIVAELESPADATTSLRVYSNSDYQSAPAACQFSGSTTAYVELGQYPYIYGVGFWSKSGKAIGIKRVYATRTLPEGVGTDAAKPYSFTARDWVSGDQGRVSSGNISYNVKANTITLKASGAQNTALQMNSTVSDNYYLRPDQIYFCVKASNVSADVKDSQMWYANGFWVTTVNPVKTIKANDSDIIVVWDIRSWLPRQPRTHLCFSRNFVNCFGLTSTTGTSVVSDIGFYTEEELPHLGTGIGAAHASLQPSGACYRLDGTLVGHDASVLNHASLPGGIYVTNGRKILK